MELMTVEELIENLDFFNDKSKSSVMSFMRTRQIKAVCRGKKRCKGFGSAPLLFDATQVVEAWNKRPIGKTIPSKNGAMKRVYSKKEENEQPILGQKQPYRAIDDCINYYGCLDEAAKEETSLKCFMCEQ